MIYYKIDMTHPQVNGALAALENGFKEVRAKNNLSVTKNLAETEAWIKLINDVDLSAFSNIIIDKAVLFEEHRLKVQKDIYSPEWRESDELALA